MNSPVTRIIAILAVIAVILGVGGTVLLQNARDLARNNAKSLCTNLSLIERDQRQGASYATETLTDAYKADLLNLGFVCESGKLKKAEKVEVTNDMTPTAVPATCETDGRLNLPQVEHAAWQKKADDAWEPATGDEGVGTWELRLLADDGYVLSAPLEQTVIVEQRLSGDACKAPTPESQYACRTAGPNGNPEFLALSPGKYGEYNYGPAFTATTIEEARQSIHDQAWCDPVWMVQKYREYVDPGISSEQAHAKVLELIAQAKASDNAQWDRMVDEIVSQFDTSENEFTTMPTGEYHSLGVITNTADGVPRIVDFIVYDNETRVLRSKVTYTNGTTAVIDLRTKCNLQLRTPVDTPPTNGPGEAPQMAQIPRDQEGTPIVEVPPAQPEKPETTVPPTAPPTTPPTAPPTTVPPSTTPPTTVPPTAPPTTTLEPKPSEEDSYAHETGAPQASTTGPAQESAEPVDTNPPTQDRDVPSEAPGANNPDAGSGCVTAPGESSC